MSPGHATILMITAQIATALESTTTQGSGDVGTLHGMGGSIQAPPAVMALVATETVRFLTQEWFFHPGLPSTLIGIVMISM